MPSGGHRHCKRLAAPSSWGLEKTGGTFAVRLLPGAHNKQLSLPLKYVVQRFLKVANTSKELTYILSNKMIAVNGKDVTNPRVPVGLFDVITVKKTNQHYRLLFNVNRKFKIHKISSEEAQFRLTKVTSKGVDVSVPYTRTLDGYNFRFVDPAVGVSDTVKVDIKTNKVVDYIKFEADKIAYVYSGSNMGRVGVIKRVEKLRDGKVFVYLTDANNKNFTVLESKAIVIGDSNALWMSLDEGAGIKYDEFELSNKRYEANNEIAVEDN
ncbi:small subunit ribosomal protein S4e [Pancytospora philotis]|nr:small subunit ribosomal protein S4e [Pancytospora philotis]